MHDKSEEFLGIMLWCADMLAKPTLRNLTGSYEQWLYHNGLLYQLGRLAKANLIERARSVDERIYRLTHEGRMHALGGRDPEERWKRRWDGLWRLVIFDIPLGKEGLRARFRRFLHDASFGCLQKSVWVTPDDVADLDLSAGDRHKVDSLIVFQGAPACGESNDAIVSSAWDFERISEMYEEHLDVLGKRPVEPLKDELSARRFQRWIAEERAAWLNAVSADPLLPECLWPAGYPGRKAWTKRKQAAASVAPLLRGFDLSSK